MPMYQPSSRRRDGDWKKEVGGGGQVLDLETAVKDGILGGGGGAISTGEKLDLKTMIERLDSIEVPSFGAFDLPHNNARALGRFVTPNSTLSHLIYSWFSQKYTAMKKKSEDVQGRALELIEMLKKKVKGQARVQSLIELRKIVNAHDSVKKTVAESGGIGMICSLLGPFTSHAVGSEAIGILVKLELGSEWKKNLVEPAKVSLMVDMLNEGSVETKINCTNMIEMLMEGKEFESEVVSRVRSSVVSIGGIPQIVELLPNLNSECLELALYVLEALSSLPEGKMALKDCSHTIPNVVKLLMRVSENCTELALSILWGVCEISPEECAPIAVDAGLAAKLLLVIQSGCNPVLKQRSAELLKLCSLNYTATIFISKCKLTRTIQ
ncbi:hypothetical protein C3L33_09299, partial [Rhododendron williamsianum]